MTTRLVMLSALLATWMGAPDWIRGRRTGVRRTARGSGDAGHDGDRHGPPGRTAPILPERPQPGPTTSRSSRSSWRRSSSAIWSTSACRVRSMGGGLPAGLVVLLGGDRGLGHQGPQPGVVGHLVHHNQLLVEHGQLAAGADQPLVGVAQASFDGGPVHGRAIVRTPEPLPSSECPAGIRPDRPTRSGGPRSTGCRRPDGLRRPGHRDGGGPSPGPPTDTGTPAGQGPGRSGRIRGPPGHQVAGQIVDGGARSPGSDGPGSAARAVVDPAGVARLEHAPDPPGDAGSRAPGDHLEGRTDTPQPGRLDADHRARRRRHGLDHRPGESRLSSRQSGVDIAAAGAGGPRGRPGRTAARCRPARGGRAASRSAASSP